MKESDNPGVCLPVWSIVVAALLSSFLTILVGVVITWIWCNYCCKGKNSDRMKSKSSKKQKTLVSDRPPGTSVLELPELKSGTSPRRIRKRSPAPATTSWVDPEKEAQSGVATNGDPQLGEKSARPEAFVKQESVFGSAEGHSLETLPPKPKQPKTEPSTMDLLRTSAISTVKK